MGTWAGKIDGLDRVMMLTISIAGIRLMRRDVQWEARGWSSFPPSYLLDCHLILAGEGYVVVLVF